MSDIMGTIITPQKLEPTYTDNSYLDTLSALEGWQEWMKEWVEYDKNTRIYSSYEPDNSIICSTPYPRLVIDSFNYSSFK